MAGGRPVGSKNRFVTRAWLGDALKSQDFDAVVEFVKLYREGQEVTKTRMIEMIFSYLFAKPRSEDGDGNPEETPKIALMTLDDAKELVKTARGEK